MKDTKYDVFDIVEWLLNKGPMTHKKIQKLLYFIYSEYLYIRNVGKKEINEVLFFNDFEAWVHGPVSLKVYNNLRGSGYELIGLSSEFRSKLSKEDDEILNKIYLRYREYTTYQLEILSHEQEPWLKARGSCLENEICTNKITDEFIFEYYLKCKK